MFRQRAPWWMYLLAASYIGYAAMVVYVEFRGPDLPGVHFPSRFAPGPAIVSAVTPGSPADRAGLQPGDRLIDFDGRATPDALMWYYALGESHADRPSRVQFERGGEIRHAVLTLERRPTGLRSASDWVRFARAALALGLAIVIAFSRPFDLQARVGALLLAEVGLFGMFFLNTGLAGIVATWRELPWPVKMIVAAPLVSPGGALLFAFASIFPRPFFRGRWAWALVLAPQFVVMAMRAYYYLFLGLRIPGWVKPVGALYFIAAIVVFVLNYRRLEDLNERRRARVVAIGAATLIMAVLPYVIMLSPGVPVANLERVLLSPGVFVSLNLLTVAFPISIAYAILRHRAFDISVVIRQGLKYAVARQTVTAVLPVLGAILAADLLMHGDQPLTDILRERGWIYAALGGVALVAQRRQRDWMESLDRRFFRERYDAQRLLREVAEQVRNARTFEGAAARVTAQIEASLHTEFAAVLVRHPGEPNYTAVAATPAGAGPPTLPAKSKLLALFRVLDKPMNLTLTDTGWLQQQLPGDETDFLRQARIEWLIPVATTEGRTEALLAVGFKRSEEPYTREDQDLLLAIAASMAMLLDRAPVTVTIPAHERSDSRVLAGRYRLDDRLGAGGMGTVYAATDTALERRVAIKLMRDEFVGNSTAAERFRREARVAAAFSHPNVVTIHDFGVASGSRAFLVMELLNGVDLRAELKREHRLPARRVIDLLRGVCSGLEAAHDRDLLHRDIKPENIFLARPTGTEIPKILDFGIAKFVSAAAAAQSTATAAGHLIGTLRYMSPEQLRGEPASVSWDMWSLAVVAYEMLSGEYPFEGSNMADWQAAVIGGRSTPVIRHLPTAPESWQAFFARALAADPRQRPRSAGDFFSQVETALAA